MNIIKTAKKVTLLTLLTLFLADNIVAQLTRTGRSRDDRRTEREDESVKDKLAYSFNIGNIGFSGGAFGSGFTVSGKAMAGYKFADAVTAGVHVKSFYDIIGIPNASDISLFSYGTGLFGRVTILQQFFLQGEYNLTSYDGDNQLAGQPFRDTFTYPMIGGGYEQGFGAWKGGIMLLFNLDEEVREIGGVGFGEYWITFSYNF